MRGFVRSGFVGAGLAVAAIAAPASATDIISTGHWDLELEYKHTHVPPKWDVHWHNHATDVEIDVDEAIVYGLFDGSTIWKTPQPRPAGSQWDFTGVAADELLYIFPKSNPGAGLPFLGIAAEETDLGVFDNDNIVLSIVGFAGPAGSTFSLYDLDTFGNPVVLMTADSSGVTGSVNVPVQSHSHYNWSFTNIGNYELILTASGAIGGVPESSGEFSAFVTVVPEPGSAALLALGGLAMLRRRRR